MDWLNIHVSVLDSAEFLGSDPVERATWLCLLRYCAGQENGGRIVGARSWKDRQWQQVCRVTQDEVGEGSRLYGWDGDDLVVRLYPVEKEAEVAAKRAGGRRGGLASARSRATAHAKLPAKHQASSASKLLGKHVESSAAPELRTERKGKERNGKEEEEGGARARGAPPSPPSPDPLREYLASHPIFGRGILDLDAFVYRSRDAFPHLDLLAVTKHAAAKILGKPPNGSGPAAYLTNFYSIADRDRVQAAERAATDADPLGQIVRDAMTRRDREVSSGR